MPLVFIAIPLFAVVVLNIIYKWAGKRTALWIGMGISVIQAVIAAVDIAACINGGVLQDVYLPGLRVDLLGAIVLFIIGLIGFVTLVVAEMAVKRYVFNFATVVLLLIIGMNGIIMVTDLFSLYVFIEVTSAASFILIAINKKRDELEGAFKYYLMSAMASVMLLLSVSLLLLLAGDTSFAAVSQYVIAQNGVYPPLLIAASILAVSGLAIKAGVVPFHTWVPDAHSSAPSPISVILAGVVIKVSGVYAMMRVFRDMFASNAALGQVLIVFGLVSIIVGALGAIGQSDIKRMLAFSSVSQIGYIMVGLGSGNVIGFVGAVMHFFNHATFKSLLFIDAAAIINQTGTRDMEKLGGLAEKMPVTGTSSVLALLSMAGIPPLSGFWSKLLVIIAVWKVSSTAAVIALLSSLITLGYFLLLQKKVFFGKVAPGLENVKECKGSIIGVEVLLSALNVGLGVLFPILLLFMQGKGLL